VTEKILPREEFTETQERESAHRGTVSDFELG